MALEYWGLCDGVFVGMLCLFSGVIVLAWIRFFLLHMVGLRPVDSLI